jgi:Patatin-like phospholipase
MKAWLRGFYYSFPIQLLFLHFRKYQALLIFWFVLFSIVNGTFLKTFGADSLFLSPEYLGNVNAISSALVGISIGMFIMSWNITTFILFSRHFKFLAATTNPFLKYCTNNSILPAVFLIFYFIKAFKFAHTRELIHPTEIFFLFGGFICGLILMLAISFLYFFRADKSIFRRMLPVLSKEYSNYIEPEKELPTGEGLMNVEWYLNSPITVKRTRHVAHYSQNFIDTIFKRHHFASVISILIAFAFLILIGFFLDYKFFQIPAAASITIFFAIFIGVAGAFAYFLQSWSIPYLVGLILLLNLFYKWDWIDPRNKAYGLNYLNKNERPSYTRDGLLQLCSQQNVEADKANMISILDNWKQKQRSGKPMLILISTSGGGNRSATFTMNILQHLDSITHGELIKKTFLISGASGGMFGASYFRELYLEKKKNPKLDLYDKKYVDDISGDLLNALFSSFVARDLISPAQKFKVGPYEYVKDRAYAFEMKLNDNTHGRLNKQLGDYAADEKAANIPLMFYNSVVTRDGKKMIISTQPVRFMMQAKQDSTKMPVMDPDAIDFTSFFANQNPYNLRILTALRMNATFPIVLPNVWLPSDPVIDVMDAGLRDNYGQETALRFLEAMDDWIRKNTSSVLLIQIRDRLPGGWEYPYVSDDISDHAIKPFLLLQHNWYKMMEYFQNDMLSYYTQHTDHNLFKVTFQYATDKEENKAALNFHLSQREKNDIASSLRSSYNAQSFQRVLQLLNSTDSTKKVE